MKKQELIHLHNLLAEVSDFLDFYGQEFDRSNYEDHGVRPTSIHKSKTNHKTAIFALLDGLMNIEENEDSEDIEAILEEDYDSLRESAEPVEIEEEMRQFVPYLDAKDAVHHQHYSFALLDGLDYVERWNPEEGRNGYILTADESESERVSV